jgi:DNA-binding response OmpR family regulator
MPARKTTILIVDDDPHILRFVKQALEGVDYRILTANNGAQALTMLDATTVDLLLLDVVMPKLDGVSVCRQVRTYSSMPIMMLTACEHEDEKILGLDAGADDYLTKPFNLEELRARVRAVLRRSTYQADLAPCQPPLQLGAFTIDFAQQQVTREGTVMPLTSTEYRVFVYLAKNAGRVLPYPLVLEHVWGADYAQEYRLLQVTIARLRAKIEADPTHPRVILTRHGVGYLLAVPAEVTVTHRAPTP